VNGDLSLLQGFRQSSKLNKVYEQLVSLSGSADEGHNEFNNISLDSLSFHNDISRNNSKIFAPKNDKTEKPSVNSSNNTKTPSNNKQVRPSTAFSKPRSVLRNNLVPTKEKQTNKDSKEIVQWKERCDKLENRCLSLAMENKLLRERLNREDKGKFELQQQTADIRHRENVSLNQSNWQPTVHDLSEIALITGLSVDRARQAFSTIIEDSTELRLEEQDSDVVQRINFLMNELNRLMDGVEHPQRQEPHSQASINFSKISEPK